MDLKPKLKTVALAVAAASFALSAVAQWQWVDKDGRKVFSDRSPPAEVQEKDILRRPGSSGRPALASVDATATVAAALKPASAASTPAAMASAPKLTGKDAELEAKKKAAEEQEVAKKKLEDEKVAKSKAENCDRAKSGMVTLKSGVRMSSVNSKGEQEVFDDAKRASETKRTQEIIESSCK